VPTAPGPQPVGHLAINGMPLSPNTPHFQDLYSFNNAPLRANILQYKENHYFGHALLGELAQGNTFTVEPDHYFVMGDNTMNSSDSRFWGDFPRSKVIGKSFFVYWPISERFGWGYR
jgi:signal peptidase I